MRWETTRPFLVSRKILGFLSIFKKSQALSLLKHWTPRASWSVKRCEPPVQMRRGTRGFSRVSTEDSDIPSSWEMKEEPAFKPLQGNPTLFLVRESRYPLHLRQKTQGPSHIPMLREGSSWGACLKLAYLFNRILGISSLLETICGAWNFLHTAVLKWMFI